MLNVWFVNSTSFGQQKAPWEQGTQKLYWVVMVRNRVSPDYNSEYYYLEVDSERPEKVLVRYIRRKNINNTSTMWEVYKLRGKGFVQSKFTSSEFFEEQCSLFS